LLVATFIQEFFNLPPPEVKKIGWKMHPTMMSQSEIPPSVGQIYATQRLVPFGPFRWRTAPRMKPGLQTFPTTRNQTRADHKKQPGSEPEKLHHPHCSNQRLWGTKWRQIFFVKLQRRARSDAPYQKCPNSSAVHRTAIRNEEIQSLCLTSQRVGL